MAGFFLAGLCLMAAGGVSKLPWSPGWSPRSAEWWRAEYVKYGPKFVRWGLKVWAAGIVFWLFGLLTQPPSSLL